MTTETAPKKSWFRRHPILTGLGVIIVLIIIVSSIGGKGSSSKTASTDQKQSAPAVEAIKISAPKLAQAYIDNEVNADSLYKGKPLEISGTIKDIGKDITDAPYVVIETNPSDYFTQVQCMFGKADIAELGALKKGSQITIRGNVSGKLGNILVRNSQVVTP